MPGAPYANMHAKSLVVDGRVLLTGSVSMTNNGFENKKKQLFRFTDQALIGQVVSDFENDWKIAEPVTQARITEMMVTWQAQKEAKKKKEVAASVQSRNKSW